MWAAINSHPDLAYSVRLLSGYFANSWKTYCNLLQRIMRYVAGSFNFGLTFCKNFVENLIEYLDSDYISLIDRRKSTGAYAFRFARGAISHLLKLQPTVSLSSCETEYMVLVQTEKEAIWYACFLKELVYRSENVLVLPRADNQRSITLLKNTKFHNHTKHIEIKWHFIRKFVESGQIEIEHISIKNIAVDHSTKPLSCQLFQTSKDIMSMQTDIIKKELSWWLIRNIGKGLWSRCKGLLLSMQECCLQITHRATHFIPYLAK